MESLLTGQWTEEFRPKRIADCILPAHIRAPLAELERSGNYPHLLFHGPSGVGKSTVARILGSHPGVLLTRLDLVSDGPRSAKQALSRLTRPESSSFFSRKADQQKVVLVDEVQTLKPIFFDLRGLLESNSAKVTFLFTTNNVRALPHALTSHTVQFDFEPKHGEDDDMVDQIAERCREVLTITGSTVAERDIVAIVENFFPDMRTIMNELSKTAWASAEG